MYQKRRQLSSWRHFQLYALVWALTAMTGIVGPTAPPVEPTLRANEDTQSPRRPRLHVVTFMNKIHRHLAYLQVSAEAHGLLPQILGYGVRAWWPDGLGAKINALREFVNAHTEDADVVVFVDAFDVLLLGGKEELLSKFLQLEQKSNRSLVFNAEEQCFPSIGDICNVDSYPQSAHRWRFLNSGAVVGRAHALKTMLARPVPDVIRGSDQYWYQEYFRNHLDQIYLDTRCELVCAVNGIRPENGVEFNADTGRITVPETGSMPVVAHFVSVAHWPSWQNGFATSQLHQAFRALYPAAASTLLERFRLELNFGPTHTEVLESTPWWASMRAVLCVKCGLLGSKQNECTLYYPSAFDSQCGLITLSLILICFASVLSCGAYCSVRFRLAVVRALVPRSRPAWLPADCWRIAHTKICIKEPDLMV